jgi:hypothetical protein
MKLTKIDHKFSYLSNYTVIILLGFCRINGYLNMVLSLCNIQIFITQILQLEIFFSNLFGQLKSVTTHMNQIYIFVNFMWIV